MDSGYGFGHSLSYVPNWNTIVGTVKDNEDCNQSRRSISNSSFKQVVLLLCQALRTMYTEDNSIDAQISSINALHQN